MNTLLLLLLACSNAPNTVESTYDPRPDWELFVPEEERTIQVPSTVRWYSDPSIASKVAPAARDWELHLSCGMIFKQVDDPTMSDITISCADFPSEGGSFLMDNGMGGITLTQQACDAGGPTVMRWALAMGMGFKQQFRWYDNEASGTGAGLELHGYPDNGWSPFETDGWRAWALERGAPGCGEDELEWSWIEDPNLYKTPPTPEAAQHLIELSARSSRR